MLTIPADLVPVYLVTGEAASGKTRFIKKLSAANPGRILHFVPDQLGQLLTLPSDWETFSAVAIDEIYTWEQTSLVPVVEKLEQAAIEKRTTLIVVAQYETDLHRLGLTLRTRPYILAVRRTYSMQIDHAA